MEGRPDGQKPKIGHATAKSCTENIALKAVETLEKGIYTLQPWVRMPFGHAEKNGAQQRKGIHIAV